MKIILLYTLLFSFVLGLEVTKRSNFEKQISSDHFKINISMNEQNKNKGDIQIHFENAIDYAKDSKICEGGKYSIFPRYIYKNSKRKFDSYGGNISFTCVFKDEEKIEDLLNSFENIEHIKISQSHIIPTLTKKQIQNAKIELEKEVFNFSNEYSAFLSTQTNKKCTTSNIDFTSHDSYHPVQYKTKALVAMDSADFRKNRVSKPLDDTKNIRISAKYRFQCKD